MKADAMSGRPNSAKKSKLRYLDLSFEGKELGFKNGDMDNGRLPHGGYRGSKKHPLGIYSFDKGREYQRQLREELDRMLESEVLEVHGSPTWSIEAHKQPTHSGESPLLANKFLSPSKLEPVNGTGRWLKDLNKRNRSSAPPSLNGPLYYRPNRMHQYLSATELRDAAENEEALRYGRPTRTTLLRARHRVGSHSANAYETRRQVEHRMDEIKNGSIFSNPKEFVQLHSDMVDGESFYSFLTGARYNRAHYLDSKSLTQYGVYMPRHNPLGCFVIGHRGDIMDTTTTPPDSPRSDMDEGSSPPTERRRPTTAPGYGRKPLTPMPPTPRQAWGDASSSLHITNGDHKKGDNENSPPVIEHIRVWSPKLNIKGSRLPLNLTREGPVRFESRLPVVHGTSLSRFRRLREPPTDDMSEANQPPPSPVPTSSRVDNHLLPAVKPEAETTDRKPADPQQVGKPGETAAAELKSVSGDQPVKVPSISPTGSEAVVKDTTEKEEREKEEEKAEEKEGGKEEAIEEEAGKVPEEAEKAGEEAEEEKEAEVEAAGAADEGTPSEPVAEDQVPAASDAQADDSDDLAAAAKAKPADDITESAATEGAPEAAGSDVPSTKEEPAEAEEGETTVGEDVKFFLTEEGGDLEVGQVLAADDDDNVAVSAQGEEAGEAVGEDEDEAVDKKVQEGGGGGGGGSRVSSAGSTKSKPGKRTVTFRDEKLVDANKDDAGTPAPGTDASVEERDGSPSPRPEGSGLSQNEAGPGVRVGEAQDTDVDDLESGQGQGHVEPLKVIVTHIERSMGAPAPKESEEEIIAEDP